MRSFAELAVLARMARAAYLTEDVELWKYAGTEKDVTYVGLFGRDDCKAALFHWNGYNVIAPRGTQVSQNFSILEVLEDLEDTTVSLPGLPLEAAAHAGAMAGLKELAAAIEPFLSSESIIICGHSLGGARSGLLKYYFIPTYKVEIIAIAPFKAGTAELWKHLYPETDAEPLVLVNEHDFAPAWPFLNPESFTLPSKTFVWLRGNSLEFADERTGFEDSVADHSIDNYCSKLAALALAEQE
jgi:hypothetical protein